uniref:Uncharacterized protein n=3 Tax=Oryza brachyantha TaxID=4533 RepID=J3MQ52_ORYBR
MRDAEEALPPRSQLHYSMKEKEGVFQMTISTNYDDIGGYDIEVGQRAFSNCHRSLLMAEDLVTQKRLRELNSGPLSLPVVAISESIRFPLLQQWVLGTFSAPPSVNYQEKRVPQKLSDDFKKWASYSRALVTQDLPTRCELTLAQIAEKLGVLKWKADWMQHAGAASPSPKRFKDVRSQSHSHTSH